MRVRKSTTHRRARKRVLKAAKGYYGARSRLYRTAKGAIVRGAVYATAHRARKKRDFRRLWIVRINAAARQVGLRYSQLVAGLKKADVNLDRKVLAQLAVEDPAAFAQLADTARSALGLAVG